MAAALRAYVRLLAVHKGAIAETRAALGGELTLSQFDLLAMLDREDGQTLADLARQLLVTAGNVTGVVDRAERDGLVVRRPDPGDRRSKRVYVTARGRRLFANAAARHAERIGDVFDALSDAELARLSRMLERIRARLEQRAGKEAS